MKQVAERHVRQISAGDLLDLARNRNVMIADKGKPKFVLIPLNGHDWESYVVSRSPIFKRILAESRKSYREKGGVSLDDVKKKFTID